MHCEKVSAPDWIRNPPPPYEPLSPKSSTPSHSGRSVQHPRNSRSEFIVLRDILKSGSIGVSNRELAKGLGDRLSHQGLADALKSLQAKGFIYKDAIGKMNGAHALYKSTAISAEAAFRNDMAEFLLSKETALTPLSVVAPPFATSGIYPSAALATGANSPLSSLRKNEDLGRKLLDAAQCIVSAWLDY